MLAAVTVATRTTDPVLVQEIDERALAAFRFDEPSSRSRALAPRSYVTVPLTARGEVFGSVTLVTAESGRVYGEEDAALAQELARHAAAAIDNARLYAESERRSRAARALEAVGDGVVLVDREGVIRLWNTAATTITGVPEATPWAGRSRTSSTAGESSRRGSRSRASRASRCARRPFRSSSAAASSGSPARAWASRRAPSTRSAT